ncbi:Uncharacterised protein [uncultured archaeon]|nr:Uncharacterised protein [uncultured archaeon]
MSKKKTKTTLDNEIVKTTKRPIYFFVIIVGFTMQLNNSRS